MLIAADEQGRPGLEQQYERVSRALVECDYLARTDITFDRSFLVATSAEWQTRYEGWLQDPVRAEMYLCDFFGVIPHDRHTAGGDAFITAQIFLRLLTLAARHGRTTLSRVAEPFVEETQPPSE